MELYKSTRVNAGNRLELITRRIEYLNGEIDSYNKELAALMEEQDLLRKLQKIYVTNIIDQIDIQRTAFLSADIERQTESNARTNRQIIIDLLDTGPASVKELALASGLTLKQVANCLYPLCVTGKIVRVDKRRYAKAV